MTELPHEAKRFERKLRDFLAEASRVAAAQKHSEVEMDEVVRRRLKSLGYLR